MRGVQIQRTSCMHNLISSTTLTILPDPSVILDSWHVIITLGDQGILLAFAGDPSIRFRDRVLLRQHLTERGRECLALILTSSLPMISTGSNINEAVAVDHLIVKAIQSSLGRSMMMSSFVHTSTFCPEQPQVRAASCPVQ